MIKKCDLTQINISDPKWKESADKNALFLDEMDDERVLSGFRQTCRIKTDARPYGGWENSLIAGHALGHFFSALSMQVKCGGDDTKAREIVKGLRECQEKLGTGFLSAATPADENNPEIQFDIVEGKQEGDQWVPWYALHKVLQGVIDLWVIAGIKEAKIVATDLGDWACRRALSWDEEIRKKVLSVEYGGMNDTLYQLYILTEKEDCLKAALIFDEPDLYDKLLGFGKYKSVKNRMAGVHANTTIPKILGYLRGALAFKKNGQKKEAEKRIEIAERFWSAVIDEQTYHTGGIGDMEHFFKDGLLDASRTQCNAESCCCYNMMKLSELLFMMTGEEKFLNYIEKALLNARLGSIGPSGGYSYFNPMATGYYRLYSPAHPKDNPFWCCVGTGMEDFAGFQGYIYYRDEKEIYVTQWISSELSIKEGKIKLYVDHKKGELLLSFSEDVSYTGGSEIKADGINIKLRIPRWIQNRDKIISDKEDFLDVRIMPDKPFKLHFDPAINILRLPDEKAVFGISYGPFVMCALLGNEKHGITTQAGIDVVAPAWKVVFDGEAKSDVTYGKTKRVVLDQEYLTLPFGENIEGFFKDAEKYIIKSESGLTLTGMSDHKGRVKDLPLVPYHETGDQRYGIYWYLKEREG